MQALLMVNARSRRGQASIYPLRRMLAALGIATIEASACDEASATKAIEDAGTQVDCVIVGGGDGTIISTIPGLIASKLPLGIIPLGTFNELARTLELPMETQAACARIAVGVVRTIDVARVNGVYFVNEASIGVSSRIARLQTSQNKQRFGFLNVLVTSLQALRGSYPFHVEIEYDGKVERFKTIQLTIANSHRFGGFITNDTAAIDDGQLDLYSVDIAHWFQAVPIAWKLMRRSAEPVPGLRLRRSPRFIVRTRRPHHVSADAEPAGYSPAQFEVLPGALSVYA
ncbi:MAG: lipid kinase [Candidatus Eremiobacteraeota bacterium]|nr:lipid kinase [Candidatus Eremiobacteraeota bacterium]